MQISLMKLIYERAGAVYAWLGPKSDDSDLAMEKIADSDSLFESALLLPTRNGNAGIESHQNPREVQETQARRALSAIFVLLCRPWWSRTWILQESTAQIPTQTLLCCGDKQLQLSTFLHFTDKIRGTLIHSHALHPGFQKLLSLPFWPQLLGFLRSRQVSAGKRPLLSLVENVRYTIATDPRDKVYAMLNFALERNTNDAELSPSYTQTLRQTYTRLALWHIWRYQCLDVFAHCGRTHSVGDQMASWTPDWRQRAAHVVFPKSTVNDDPGSEPLYRASGAHMNGLQLNAPLPVDTQLLTLCGLNLCQIGRVAPRTNVQTRGFEVEDTWRPVDGSLRCPLNNITMEEVFRRTMYIDLRARFDDQQRINFERQRGGDFSWPPSEVADLEKDYPDMVNLKRNTMGRCVFYTRSSSDSQGLMGLGPHDAKVSDQVWMLQGGKVLYVLRQKAITEAVAYRSLDLSTGCSEEMVVVTGDVVYELVGECFVLGLMDGEILDMLGDEPRRPRPTPLCSMARKFRKIGLV
jgi:hypothetical protein